MNERNRKYSNILLLREDEVGVVGKSLCILILSIDRGWRKERWKLQGVWQLFSLLKLTT